MNDIHTNRSMYEKLNYVLKADSKSDYWFGISKNKIDRYVTHFGNNFNLVLYGNEDAEGDYYVIPYVSIKDILVEENLYLGEERNRWVGDIKNHILRFRKSKTDRNVSQYYSLPISIVPSKKIILSEENINDYSIENAKREISIRLKQSKFRSEVLRNFEFKCCLTQLTEPDLIVASHIIPWADRIDTRLNPGNGLCFSVLYDKLFDKGYFTIDYKLKVVITTRFDSVSDSTKKYLKCLEFHNNNIFEKFHHR